MSNLNDARQKINAIDKEMAKLFVERMKVSKEVAEYKMEHGLPIFDRCTRIPIHCPSTPLQGP